MIKNTSRAFVWICNTNEPPKGCTERHARQDPDKRKPARSRKKLQKG
jgi:hypothetical protein